MPTQFHRSTEPRGRVVLVADCEALERELRASLAACEALRSLHRVPLAACSEVVPPEGSLDFPDLVIVAGESVEISADCVREIRASDHRRIVPLVVLCRTGDAGLQACLDAGANGLLPSDAEGGLPAAVLAAASFWLAHNLLLRAHDS